MAELAIVNMEADSHLWTADLLIGDTGIVWVEFKSNTIETLAKLLVVEQACHHGSVYGVLALYNQLFGSLPIRSYVRHVDTWGNV
jgi:hypothetical protein